MKYNAVPFIGEAYTSKVPRIDVQNCINLYLQREKVGAKTSASLLGTPGMVEFADCGAGEGRGFISTSVGRGFAVIGNRFVEVLENGTSADIGTLETDSGMVEMSENGSQVMIVDGEKGYLYFLANMSFNPDDTDSVPPLMGNSAGDFIQITDPDFPAGTFSLTYMDGYFIVLKPGPIGTGLFSISDSLDGRVWAGLEFGSAEKSPDKLIAMRALGDKLIGLGSKSKEFFYNSGDVSFPFDRVEGAFHAVGTISRSSVVVLRGSAYWVGAALDGSTGIWRTSGYSPELISTLPIAVGLDTWTDAIAYGYEQEGHAFYVVTSANNKLTWAYDATTGAWHQRVYRDPVSGEEREHPAIAHAFLFGKNLVLAKNSGKVFHFDLDVGLDDGAPIIRERTGQVLDKNGDLLSLASFLLEMETGIGSGNGADSEQAKNPQAMLRISRDGGYVFGNEDWRPIGRVGARHTRVKWTRCGTSDDFRLKVRFSTPRRIAIIKAEAEFVAEE